MKQEEIVNYMDSKIEGRYSVIEEALSGIYEHIGEITSSLDCIRYLEFLKNKISNK